MTRAPAREAYEAAAAYLREQTRDRKAYPLVYEALCEYGFRRNLWGLKPIGLTFSLLGFAASVALLVAHYGCGTSISADIPRRAGPGRGQCPALGLRAAFRKSSSSWRGN